MKLAILKGLYDYYMLKKPTSSHCFPGNLQKSSLDRSLSFGNWWKHCWCMSCLYWGISLWCFEWMMKGETPGHTVMCDYNRAAGDLLAYRNPIQGKVQSSLVTQASLDCSLCSFSVYMLVLSVAVPSSPIFHIVSLAHPHPFFYRRTPSQSLRSQCSPTWNCPMEVGKFNWFPHSSYLEFSMFSFPSFSPVIISYQVILSSFLLIRSHKRFLVSSMLDVFTTKH